MLLEKQVELKMIERLEPVLSAYSVGIESSWEPAQSGSLKREELQDKDALVSLFIQPRTHDEFSLPMVTMIGTLVIDARVEKCPTMAEVSPIYNAVISKFDEWHYDCDLFSEEISLEDFYAAALNMNGGNNISLNQSTSTWQMTLTFQIRGTEDAHYVPKHDIDALNQKIEKSLSGDFDL